jgi:hypothetical protein
MKATSRDERSSLATMTAPPTRRALASAALNCGDAVLIEIYRDAVGAKGSQVTSAFEQAPAELTVKIPRQSCRRFTLGGLLPEGAALINVTQSRDEEVVGGLATAEENG